MNFISFTLDNAYNFITNDSSKVKWIKKLPIYLNKTFIMTVIQKVTNHKELLRCFFIERHPIVDKGQAITIWNLGLKWKQNLRCLRLVFMDGQGREKHVSFLEVTG